MSTQTRTQPGLAEHRAEDVLFHMHHLDNAFRPINILLLLTLVFLAVGTALMFWGVFGDGFSDTALWYFCGLYTLTTVVIAVSKALRPAPRNWLSPDIVFWLVYTMFHVPYVVLYLVGLADYSHVVFHVPEAANRAMCVVVLCGIGFLMGYELGPMGREQPARYRVAYRIPSGVFLGGQVLFLISFVTAVFIIAFGLGPAILSYGYSGFRRIERFVGPEMKRWITLSTMFVRIGLTVYLAGCILRHRKVFKGILLPALLTVILVFFLLLGARSEVAVACLPMIVAYHYFVKPLRLVLGIPALLALLILFGAIGIGRKAESLSPSAIYQAYENYRKDTGVNPFVASLAESGSSLKTVNVACGYIPSTEPYWLGRSLFDSALMVIPNPVPGLRRDVAPSTWATLVATGRAGGERAGWGASIAMEAYMNFGVIGGAIFLGVIGFFIRRVYDTTLRRPTFLQVCFLLVTVTSMALWCRNHANHFFRPVVWTVLAAWLTQSIFGGTRTAFLPKAGKKAFPRVSA